MKMWFKRLCNALLIAALFMGLFPSCKSKSSTASVFEKNNDIVTFTPPQKGKTIVRIATSMNMNWQPVLDALSKKFPDKQFIYDFYALAGNGPSQNTVGRLIKNNNYDFVIATANKAPLYGADISSQAFLDNYLQTTLDSLSDNGHIYAIPLPMSASAIFYNKDLFAENGWTVPSSIDDFFALCDEIRSKGYIPFKICSKYAVQTLRMLEGILYDQTFQNPDSMSWYANLVAGKASFTGNAEPIFNLAKKLFDEGILTTDDFSASLTTMRKDFFEGKTAMIEYSSDILTLAKTEKCDFEIGLMPYPSADGKNPCILYNPTSVMFIPAEIKNDAGRFKSDLAVLDYLSTPEGQNAFLSAWSGVISLKHYEGNDLLYQEASDYIKSGAFHAVLNYEPTTELGTTDIQNLINNTVKSIGNGTDVNTAITELDQAYNEALSKGGIKVQYDTIAQATKDFTVLETSYYIADKIKAATNADVALVPNGCFYRSNLADIPKGEITNDTRIFYMKGIGGKDFITTYKITGTQLKTLLEHPIINGMEQTQFIAASGLSVEYAPWHQSGSRVVKVTMKDGAEIDDAQLYTVAAYKGVIDDSYITSTVQTFDSFGDPQTFIEKSLRADGTISPDITSRVKLNWDIQSAD